MSPEISLALLAFCFNSATIILTVISLKKKASGEYVKSLKDEMDLMKHRLEKCQKRLEDCERERRRLEKREMDLMRELIERGLSGKESNVVSL